MGEDLRGQVNRRGKRKAEAIKSLPDARPRRLAARFRVEDADDPQSLISYIDRAALDKLKANGKIADGMLPKAAAIDSALENGVGRVHVISYKVPDSLLLEVFTNEGTGTLVGGVHESNRHQRR